MTTSIVETFRGGLGIYGLGVLLLVAALLGSPSPAGASIETGSVCVEEAVPNRLPVIGVPTRGTNMCVGLAASTAVSAGGSHTCVLLSTGNVDCYGYSGFGQAADYTGGNAVAVSSGRAHTCVLLSTGNVDCYGSNGSGRAADYTGGNAVAVSAGGSHTCVLLSTSNVNCYGFNDYGQAGDYTHVLP